MQTKIIFNSIDFLGTDYLGRKVNLVKGKIKLKDNKKFTKHIAFFVNNKFNFMPLYEDIKRINNIELNEDVHPSKATKLVKDHYLNTMTEGTIDIIMVSDDEFVSKTSVSELPLDKEITISI
jgi:predicted subunit of tRNA(5-methylaminomethyl-2-thiouridylate) methyltransferase